MKDFTRTNNMKKIYSDSIVNHTHIYTYYTLEYILLLEEKSCSGLQKNGLQIFHAKSFTKRQEVLWNLQFIILRKDEKTFLQQSCGYIYKQLKDASENLPKNWPQFQKHWKFFQSLYSDNFQMWRDLLILKKICPRKIEFWVLRKQEFLPKPGSQKSMNSW